jgi:hypothetical protein
MSRKRRKHPQNNDRASSQGSERPPLAYHADEHAFYREAMPKLPEGQTTYRVITGSDESDVSTRVSQALAQGYKLYGPPSIAFNGQTVVIAQALLWSSWREPYYDDDLPY